ncbi:sugar phosphate isomerase/epimerase family protein [Salibacterium qingdaonense]|nr:sugar phosphate isomerase/epimerase [Salibacterium qingdaonense]
MMKLGISTYAFRWEIDEMEPGLETILHFVRKTKELGGEVFQICDHPPIEYLEEEELLQVKEAADNEGIELEAGTQGITPDHIRKYIHIARVLGAKTLRTMVHSKEAHPSMAEAKEWLKDVVPELEEHGVKIALETYEPIKTRDLVDIVEEVGSPHIGICLDPGNSISELEFPRDVIDQGTAYATNVHLKDFVFQRKDKSIGFDLIGAPVGEGQLDVAYLLESLQKEDIQVNAIVELWLPFQDSVQETIDVEDEWMERSLKNMKKALNREHV